MARRMIIRAKPGTKVTANRPILAEDTFERIGIKTPLYGSPEFEFEGDFEYEIEELRDYVQVEFVNKLRGAPNILYTYIDPGLDLSVGDLVDVPSKYGPNNLAIVRKLGADDETLADFIVKEVTAVYIKMGAEAEVVSNDDEYPCPCGDPDCFG